MSHHPSPDVVAGYPQLSDYMGLLPQLCIVRSFGHLGSRNILYFQAELVALEEELYKVERVDERQGDEEQKKYRRCWQPLKDSASHASTFPEKARQLEIVLEIRRVLKEYCKTGSSEMLILERN
jgi:hypothetical protein